jgi:hypothetical protein
MNNNIITDNQIYDFVDSAAANTGRHMVLFYEEPEYAYEIEFRFLRRGLQKEQFCIFMVHEDDEAKIVEKKMKGNGIDVERFRSKNLLHIIEINNPMSHPEGELKGAEEIMTSGIPPVLRNRPAHIVSRLIPQVKTEKERIANVNIEQRFHSMFHNLNISLMCPYPVEDIRSELESENDGGARWMKSLLCNHHAVIYALKSSKGIALNLDATTS